MSFGIEVSVLESNLHKKIADMIVKEAPKSADVVREAILEAGKYVYKPDVLITLEGVREAFEVELRPAYNTFKSKIFRGLKAVDKITFAIPTNAKLTLGIKKLLRESEGKVEVKRMPFELKIDKSKRKLSTTIQLPEDVMEALNSFKEKSGVSKNIIIERSLRALFEGRIIDLPNDLMVHLRKIEEEFGSPSSFVVEKALRTFFAEDIEIIQKTLKKK